MAKQVEKILRVGLIQKGRIIEERLLRKREPVTVGWSPKNTFVIPVQALPSTFTLFELQHGDYLLNFKDGTKGRISLDAGVVDLTELPKQGKARRKGELFQFPLGDKARGKVVLGEVTLLFQFVTPPPLPPRLKLPATARGGILRSMDWALATMFMISALLVMVPTIYLRINGESLFPEVRRTEAIPEHFVKMEVKEEDFPNKPKEDEGKEAKKEEKPEEKKEETKKEETKVASSNSQNDAEQAARAAAERKRALAKAVQGKTLLKFLTTNSESEGGGSQMVDSLTQGTARTKIDDAFAGATGVTTASAETERSRRGGAGADGDTGTVATIKDLSASGAQRTVGSAGERAERRVTANIQVAGPDKTFGAGKMAPDEIARVVKMRINAVKNCYERELKKDPKLAGKIVIQFTIGEVGRVTDSKVASSSMSNEAVGRCILARMGGWRFPAPQGGSVTVSYPFVFTASQ